MFKNLRGFLFALLFILILPKLASQTKDDFASTPIVTTFDILEAELNKDDDTVRIINFWASWCIPCLKEFPEFQKAVRKYEGSNIIFIFISLDFQDQIKERVVPVIQRFELKGKHYLLDDPDGNRWIPLVSEKWTGAIPATLIYKRSKRFFMEGTLNYEDLIVEIENIRAT